MASAAPGGAGAAGVQDQRGAAAFMLQASKQLRALKARMLLRLDEGGRLDAAAGASCAAWRGAAAGVRGGYLRPVSPQQAEAARALERAVLRVLQQPNVVLPVLVGSLHNMARRARPRARACTAAPRPCGRGPRVLEGPTRGRSAAHRATCLLTRYTRAPPRSCLPARTPTCTSD